MDIIETLQFLRERVFTEANIRKAAELGKSLGEVLAEAYAFVDEMRAQADNGSRDLTLERRIEEAGLTAMVLDMQGRPF